MEPVICCAPSCCTVCSTTPHTRLRSLVSTWGRGEGGGGGCRLAAARTRAVRGCQAGGRRQAWSWRPPPCGAPAEARPPPPPGPCQAASAALARSPARWKTARPPAPPRPPAARPARPGPRAAPAGTAPPRPRAGARTPGPAPRPAGGWGGAGPRLGQGQGQAGGPGGRAGRRAGGRRVACSCRGRRAARQGPTGRAPPGRRAGALRRRAQGQAAHQGRQAGRSACLGGEALVGARAAVAPLADALGRLQVRQAAPVGRLQARVQGDCVQPRHGALKLPQQLLVRRGLAAVPEGCTREGNGKAGGRGCSGRRPGVARGCSLPTGCHHRRSSSSLGRAGAGPGRHRARAPGGKLLVRLADVGVVPLHVGARGVCRARLHLLLRQQLPAALQPRLAELPLRAGRQQVVLELALVVWQGTDEGRGGGLQRVPDLHRREGGHCGGG
jgi:hypothetical protein